jgi:hypothetical protein
MQSFGRQTRRKSAPLLLAGAVSCTDWSMLEAHGDDRARSSADRIREPQTSAKSTDRWNNEGGAPSGGGRSARKRRRGTSLQKKAAAEKSPKKQPRWPR